MKPLTVDLPYPTIDGIEKNTHLATVINPAYAGFHGEMTAILQYVYHAFYFEKLGDGQTAKVLNSIAVAEMGHLDVLGSLILQLGADPIFAVRTPFSYQFYNAAAVTYSKTPQKMLLDDISSELCAIEDYKSMLSVIDDEKVSAVIARIKLDEDLHVLALKERLTAFS